MRAGGLRADPVGDAMPLRDSATELVEDVARVRWARALESRDGGERERVHRVVTPFADYARDGGEPPRLERAIRRHLTLEPFDVVGLSREQKGSIGGEKDILVPSREVDREGGISEIDECPEASKLRRNEHRPQRLTDN